MPMADVAIELLRAHFRQLRLPTMGQEFERLARDVAVGNQTFIQFLLGLTELELAARAANAVAARIRNADFPVEKDFDTFDFTALPGLSKPKVLELGRCEWIEHKFNCCLIGSHGTGKTHISIGLGLAVCRAGLRVRFFTAAEPVSRLESEQKQYKGTAQIAAKISFKEDCPWFRPPRHPNPFPKLRLRF
jgi:DNA replication protein DnaC